MSKKDLEFFKELLLKKKKKAQKNLEYLKSTVLDSTTKEASGDHSSYSYHMADQGTDAMEREKSFMFAARDEKFIKQIDEALERIENETYGICRVTGNLIQKERLIAVPTTTISVDAKKADKK
ncbi:MAG: TraR/DksA family transcriptional regulator [Calditrichaeota bacterium]|nr:MAG: TraR/DksA family transcriptional regulator [Calditrichota bacterium]MBL1204407.1 TraR/DksA family transcriptional regulator [Calditrichota bacterium]NOG44236.1 TraR/DksA family transcriptional regulator [Calditrichota bacterium]